MNLANLLLFPSLIVPDAVAVIDPTSVGPRLITYSSLLHNVAKVVGLLRVNGVEPGDRVGVLATNSVESLEVIFGAAAAGAVIVPMNYRASTEEAAHLQSDSQSTVLFSESRYRDLVEATRSITADRVIYLDDGYSAQRDEAAADASIAEVDPDAVAALLYTSGTTSRPKGVQLTHGGMTGYVMGANDAADGTDNGRMLLAAPLYHIAGLTSMLNALYAGRVTIITSQFDPEQWLHLVETYRVTHGFLVPTMLARLLDTEAFARVDLSSLEAITYGAAPMPAAVIRRAIEAFPPSVAFAGAYGQTETNSTVAVLGPEDHRLDDAKKVVRLRSVGRVLEDVEVRVMGSDGTVVPPEVVGEVQVRTYRAMAGYWGAQEQTRVTVDGEGWVHTGDLGYLDGDGYLFLTGRSGDMIIRGGENISPEEVETVLYEHAGVLEAAVVGVPDETWGERVEAVVVLRPGASASDVAEHARTRLTSFKRPDRIHVLGELPRTSTGKLLRRQLLPFLEVQTE
jgi:acyl-CoA synthetase (AMP-forming)/AMP-acid ligase II